MGLNIDIYGIPFSEHKLNKKVEFNIHQLNSSLTNATNFNSKNGLTITNHIELNPATGLPIINHSGIDISGSPIGLDLHSINTYHHGIDIHDHHDIHNNY